MNNGHVHHTECPVCGSDRINPLLTVKDFSVSGKEFVVWQCGACSLRFTQDAPDAASIGAYYQSEEYISHTDTTKGLVNKAYQAVRNYTLQQKKNLITAETGVQKGAVLDVGCGTGAFLGVMKGHGWQTTGIEPDPGARGLAKKLHGIGALEPSALYDLPAGSFDAITLWHVLEHVHDLHPYVERLRELLKEKGKIFIAVPNYQSVDAGIYRLYWAAYDVPRHLYHFSPRSVEVLMQRHRLKVTAKKPMWFDSFYISLLSSKYRSGSTRWLSALVSGIRSNLAAAANTDRCSSLIYVVEKA